MSLLYIRRTDEAGKQFEQNLTPTTVFKSLGSTKYAAPECKYVLLRRQNFCEILMNFS